MPLSRLPFWVSIVPVCTLALITSCRDPGDGGGVDASDGEVFTVDRGDLELVLEGWAGEASLLEARIELDGERVNMSYRDDAGRELRATVEIQARSVVRPAAEVSDGVHVLTLSGPIEDGRPRWLATLDGVDFDVDLPDQRAALAGALGETEIGAGFLRLLPFRDKVRAKMAETRTLFEVAGLAAAVDEWPPLHLDDDDLEPPGMLPGDTPSLGMTCATSIRCPGTAPYCVTPTHDEVHGVCLRTCVDDDDCLVADGVGRCGIEVGDVPGVSGTLRMCAIGCADEICPNLLTCDGGSCAPGGNPRHLGGDGRGAVTRSSPRATTQSW